MGAIDDDARLVEALDHLEAEGAEARVGSLLAAIAHAVLHVVGQLDHADAQSLVGVDQVEVVLDRLGSLEVEEHAELAGGLSRREVSGARDLDKPRVLIDGAEPVPSARRVGPARSKAPTVGPAALTPPSIHQSMYSRRTMSGHTASITMASSWMCS